MLTQQDGRWGEADKAQEPKKLITQTIKLQLRLVKISIGLIPIRLPRTDVKGVWFKSI